jgi:hypothetical protein
MEHHELTELQYSADREGPWALYLYDINGSGYYSGKQWFAKKIKYPDEEISIDIAETRAMTAITLDREVRITDALDNLVYHARGGKVLYGENFWQEIKG